MIVVVDNEDASAGNLKSALQSLGHEVQLVPCREASVSLVRGLSPSHLVLSSGASSPGPEDPNVILVRGLNGTIPILGVNYGCLAIALALGAGILKAPRLLHGEVVFVSHDQQAIYRGLSHPFVAGCCHSFLVDKHSLPPALLQVASSERAEVMGVRHRLYPTEGVQFHPESFLTMEGHKLLENFVLL